MYVPAYIVKHCKNKWGFYASYQSIVCNLLVSLLKFWLPWYCIIFQPPVIGFIIHLNNTRPWHPWMDSRGQVNYLFFDCLGSQQTFSSWLSWISYFIYLERNRLEIRLSEMKQAMNHNGCRL